MFQILKNRNWCRLFAAQVIALIGTGLMTIALGLLAWDLAGANAGAVLGTALAIKMLAYLGIAPVAQAMADRIPRRSFLVAMDLIRAAVALCLPFVTEIWQIYTLIFVLQAASAGFTPAFQAVIPEILPDEEDYTRALSLSRLAYDLESLLSPMLAAALLTVISFHALFAGTVIGFLVSAALVIGTVLPATIPSDPQRSIWERTTRGTRLYLATPRLRGLLAISLAIAAAGSMVIVNTVVVVKARFGLGEAEVALALGAFGAGSMVAALALPRLLHLIADRPLMIGGAIALVLGTLIGPQIPSFTALLALWFLIGLAWSLTQTPSGRLLRRSAHAEDRPALFAAHFALSHGCWLICYPLAGRFGAAFGLQPTAVILALIGMVGVLLALRFWPAGDPSSLAHEHPDLPPDHPHLHAHGGHGGHRHDLIVDDLHPRWQTG